ncbi:hypothetical protein KDRO_C07970 [Kluyveromyces lactis]|nr:hypothetical protein KDRO_C07970 [Kluyveromyces lactis]
MIQNLQVRSGSVVLLSLSSLTPLRLFQCGPVTMLVRINFLRYLGLGRAGENS